MTYKTITYAPGLFKIFDEILVNAADNKVRDPTMDTVRVDIDQVRAGRGVRGVVGRGRRRCMQARGLACGSIGQQRRSACCCMRHAPTPPPPPPACAHAPPTAPLQETNMIRVYNNGLGIPVEVHKEEGVYVPELIFGHLLTSSNYNDKDAKVRAGGWSEVYISGCRVRRAVEALVLQQLGRQLGRQQRDGGGGFSLSPLSC